MAVALFDSLSAPNVCSPDAEGADLCHPWPEFLTPQGHHQGLEFHIPFPSIMPLSTSPPHTQRHIPVLVAQAQIPLPIKLLLYLPRKSLPQHLFPPRIQLVMVQIQIPMVPVIKVTENHQQIAI